MAVIANLKPGQVLFTVRRHQMGNTNIRTLAVHTVKVIEVHEDHVVASWNGNAQRKYYAGQVAKWKVKAPVLVKSGYSSRLATRAEQAAMTS
ncbi:hypothetical protein G3A43_07120 [Paraburkholderia aspalathi]|nr:hypothetical protein [Paraburkholderia aspalathi]MBK3780023.1 hypothetical protein [Paraburkholderia aspalathi]